MSSETKFNAWAAYASKEPLKPFQYVPRPLGPSDIEIKISHCGICGSDLHTIESDWGTPNFPVVVGHEIVGTVVKAGPSVSNLAVGDIVGVGAQVYACRGEDCRECSHDLDPHCPKGVFTYNAKYADGENAYGGYSESVRVDSHYAFKIPAEISNAEAAPLMCAGATVFTPMLEHKMKAGDRVGVVGIGGLGHLAIQFANGLGCKVTAISHSLNKKEECTKLGASEFIYTGDATQAETAKKSLDYLIITSNSKSNDYGLYGSLVDYNGKIILLAAPSTNLELSPFFFISNQVYIGGSLIGGIKQIKATLEFAAKHNIRPLIEKVPMANVNEGLDKVREGKVRYRVVLEN
ncbi:hypothetical protein BB559_006051 [Furculomyces boomerangus]|uniref:Enoyl reductase (ER) domain-containing protein n=2 Tax=Harpellales TaxID=61421 RepID=A0A2T9Y586_9FUNG|nr:hypothetical protein BB559_006051 [Furculomyces boomerangus]PWA00735.1 hypothetical protein BB558_003213 [Smittium angustum]